MIALLEREGGVMMERVLKEVLFTHLGVHYFDKTGLYLIIQKHLKTVEKHIHTIYLFTYSYIYFFLPLRIIGGHWKSYREKIIVPYMDTRM